MKKEYNFFKLIIIDSLIVFIIFPLIKIPFFSGVNTYRYLLIFELISAIFIGLFFEKYRKNIVKLRRKRKKKIESKKGELIRIIYFTLILLPTFLNLIPINKAQYTIRGFLFNQYQQTNFGEIFTFDADITTWDDDDIKMINWIKENTTMESRILMEIPTDQTKLILSGGHNELLLHFITGREFSTGYSTTLYWKYDELTSFKDNLLYGKKLLDYGIEELEFFLNYYNSEFIIVFSQISKIFFHNISNDYPDHFEIVQETNKYNYYRYKKPLRSRLIDLDNNLIMEELNYANNNITFTLDNYSSNQIIVYSVHDYYNWNVYIDGIKVEKIDNELGLISFKVPDSKNEKILIEIIFEKSLIEKISEFISITTLFIIVVYLFLNEKRKRHKIK